MLNKLLCFFGIHKWQYNKEKDKRFCLHCNKCQEHWANAFWLECIDGEPIE